MGIAWNSSSYIFISYIFIFSLGYFTGDVAYAIESPNAISGVVFEDVNVNGILDTGDPGIPNWWLQINGTFTNGTNYGPVNIKSDLGAFYSFSGLSSGVFDLKIKNVPGWKNTTQSIIDDLNFLSGSGVTIDFGNYKLGRIIGLVYNDTNANSIKDFTDTPLPNWTVNLSKDGNTITTTTDQNSQFTFTDVDSGNYTLSVDLPSPYIASQPVDGTYDIEILSSTVINKQFGVSKVDSSPPPPTSNTQIIFVSRDPNPDPASMAQVYSTLFLEGDMLYQFANELLPPEFDSFPGETSITFFSLTDVRDNVDLLVDNGYEWITYDLEPQFSPPEDIANAVESTTLAAEAAHAAGLKIMLSPATFPNQFYFAISPHVDGVIIQGQQLIGVDPLKVRERTEPLVNEMRTINPAILIYLQYNPSLATFDQMVTAYQDNKDLMDGHTVFYSCNCVLDQVGDFLNYLQQQRTL